MRKRRTKFTWFPVIGGDQAVLGGGLLDLSTTTQQQLVQSDGSTDFSVITIIPDAPKELVTNTATDHLVDFIGTSWLIARLVGKLHLAFSQNPNDPTQTTGQPSAAIVSAGFFVARADATAPGVPIGEAADAESDYGPLAAATQREPWMWRRTWILGNNAAPGSGGPLPTGSTYPATNASRSVVDGPHIDCKVKRRSSNDERLFFALHVAAYPAGTASGGGDGVLTSTLDLRVLGAVRRQRNRSAF